MTQEEINKGNKIIAEFMGAKWHEHPINKDESEFIFPISPDPSSTLKQRINLRYHSEWNWLMPVVEKIEAKGFWTAIYGHTSFENKYKSCSIKKQDRNSEGGYVYNFEGEWFESKIEAVFQACVDFAKWYNNQIE